MHVSAGWRLPGRKIMAKKVGARLPGVGRNDILPRPDECRSTRLLQGLIHTFKEVCFIPADADVRLETANLGDIDADGWFSRGKAFAQLERPALPDHRIILVRQQQNVEYSQ